MHLSNNPGAESIDYGELTAASAGYTGNEIQHIVNKVAMESVKASLDGKDPKSLFTSDVLEAIGAISRQMSVGQVEAHEATVLKFNL